MKTTLPLAVLFIVVISVATLGVDSLPVVGIMHHVLVGLHLLAVGATLLLVLYADERALHWMRTRDSLMSLRTVRLLHYGVAAGLGLIIITGAFLFLPAAGYYLSRPAFVVKMIAVAALIVNSALLDRLSQHATVRSFASLSRREKTAFLMSGAVSALGWLTALGGGLLLHH